MSVPWRHIFRLALIPALMAGALKTETPPRPLTPAEQRVGLLMNFARFTVWPAGTFEDQEDRKAPLVIGILADDETYETAAEALQRGPAPRVQGRAVAFRQLDPPEEQKWTSEVIERCVREAEQVHVLYLGDLPRPVRKSILESLRERPVLTVSAEEHFIEDEGMIGLFTVKDRYRFDIHKVAVDRARLQLNAKVLELARRILRE